LFPREIRSKRTDLRLYSAQIQLQQLDVDARGRGLNYAALAIYCSSVVPSSRRPWHAPSTSTTLAHKLEQAFVSRSVLTSFGALIDNTSEWFSRTSTSSLYHEMRSIFDKNLTWLSPQSVHPYYETPSGTGDVEVHRHQVRQWWPFRSSTWTLYSARHKQT
jgi:hypothetical protein